PVRRTVIQGPIKVTLCSASIIIAVAIDYQAGILQTLEPHCVIGIRILSFVGIAGVERRILPRLQDHSPICITPPATFIHTIANGTTHTKLSIAGLSARLSPDNKTQ